MSGPASTDRQIDGDGDGYGDGKIGSRDVTMWMIWMNESCVYALYQLRCSALIALCALFLGTTNSVSVGLREMVCAGVGGSFHVGLLSGEG
jgi:hypothetical protein